MTSARDDSENGVPGQPTVTTDQGVQELVGLLASSALAAMTRLAKDSDQAPNVRFQIDHARMSARAFKGFRFLEDYAGDHGFDLAEAAASFAELYDELEARTRPSNWWERSVKTYVVIGIFADALQQLNDRHQLFEGPGPIRDFGQGQWEREYFAPLAQTDPQLASRMSLWARRVAGEALALLRATLFTYPNLAADPDTVDAVVLQATKNHQERMQAINLKA